MLIFSILIISAVLAYLMQVIDIYIKFKEENLNITIKQSWQILWLLTKNAMTNKQHAKILLMHPNILLDVITVAVSKHPNNNPVKLIQQNLAMINLSCYAIIQYWERSILHDSTLSSI